MSNPPGANGVELMGVKEAQQLLLEDLPLMEPISLPLINALGFVLAKDIKSPDNIPSFSNSAMDGFAVRSSDVENSSNLNPTRLRVIGDAPAGKKIEQYVIPGTAVRIMTGAALPDGADAVVPVEYTDYGFREAGTEAPGWVNIFLSVTKGEHIRQVGQDVKAGQLVLEKGHTLRPQDVGFAGMLGLSYVSVYRKPRVAIFSSGDELLSPGDAIIPGKIYDANSYMIYSQVELAGGEAISIGISPDDPEEVQKILERAVEEKADMIVSSAGVSVGAMDFVRNVVEKNGHLDFWRVNMRPGKPMVYGRYRNIPFIGLPGNPVSAFVGFEVFVRPAIKKMQGCKQIFRQKWLAYLNEPIESDGRESYLRAVVEEKERIFHVWLTGHQGSGNLHSLVKANAFLVVPSGVKSLPSGEPVEVWFID